MDPRRHFGPRNSQKRAKTYLLGRTTNYFWSKIPISQTSGLRSAHNSSFALLSRRRRFTFVRFQTVDQTSWNQRKTQIAHFPVNSRTNISSYWSNLSRARPKGIPRVANSRFVVATPLSADGNRLKSAAPNQGFRSGLFWFIQFDAVLCLRRPYAPRGCF